MDTHLSREKVPYRFGDRSFIATGLEKAEPHELVLYNRPDFNWFVVNKAPKDIQIKAKLPADSE